MDKILDKWLYVFYTVVVLTIVGLGLYFYNNYYGFTILDKDITMILGDNYDIIFSANNGILDLNNYNISFSNDNVKMKKLTLTAEKEGTTVITFKSKKGYNVQKMNIKVITDTVASITTNENIELKVDDTVNVKPVINEDKKISSNIGYESSNPEVAKVDEKGNVTAVGTGNATIKIIYSDDVFTYTNIEVPDKTVELSGIEVPESIDLNVGEIKGINVVYIPDNATNRNATLTSANDKIAKIVNGNVVGLKAGETKVTVKVGKITKTIKIKVTEVATKKEEPEKYTLYLGTDSSSSEIKVNEQVSLVCYIVSNKGMNKKCSNYNLSNNSVMITKNKIIGVQPGTVTISVDEYGQKASLTLNVKTNIVEANSISISPKQVSILTSSMTHLVATVSPSNTTNKKVTWTSSNNNIATVSNGEVIGLKAGTVTITATTSNGKKTAATVVVNNRPVQANSIAISPSKLTINTGSVGRFSTSILPLDTTNKNVTWTSSNNNIATVSNGEVVGLNAGTVTITATTSNGKKATATVKINKKPTSTPTPTPTPTPTANDPFPLIRGSLYKDAFLHFYAGLYKNYGYWEFEYNTPESDKIHNVDRLGINNECGNPNNDYEQFFTLFPGNNLPVFTECHIDKSDNSKIYTATQPDGTNDKYVRVYPNDNQDLPNSKVQLNINTFGKKYDVSSLASQNVWPHLLITGRTGTNGTGEDSHFNNLYINRIWTKDNQQYFYFTKNNQIDLNVDVRIVKLQKGNPIAGDVKDGNGNPIQAFQYLLYLQLYCDHACGGSQKMFWFGFNLFDDRKAAYDYNDIHAAIDPGTASFNVLMPSTRIYTNGTLYDSGRFVNNEWVKNDNNYRHVHVNVSEMIGVLINILHDKGYPDLEAKDLRYGGFNIGYEVHGEYYGSMMFKNLSLTSTKK